MWYNKIKMWALGPGGLSTTTVASDLTSLCLGLLSGETVPPS